MHAPAHRPRRLLASSALALVAILVVALPAAAFDSGWTKPKRVFAHDSPPPHSMVTDAAGSVHIATEKGGTGVWYVTNASGSWTKCQVSDGNDRRPSIALDGTVVHVAFARTDSGQRGIYTASSDQAGTSGCGWAITKRYSGSASHPSMGAFAGVLSIAYRTGDRKLKFLKGRADGTDWGSPQVIDGKCCTSPVVLALTTKGSPRVAYGDGASKAEGLKYAFRGGGGWKKKRVHGGRIKHVDMVLDMTPPLFGGEPSNKPHLLYVVKRKGLYLANKNGSRWDKRGLGGAQGGSQLNHHSNVTFIVYSAGGNLGYLRASGAIWSGGALSGSGRDGKPQLDGGQLTFSRKGASAGIYYTKRK